MASGAAAAAGAAATASMSASLAVRFRKLLSSQPASRIILGTASSSRRQIMDGLATDFNFSYEVVKADIDEKAIRHTQPRQLVTALAHAKADAIVAKLHQQQLSAPQDQQQQPSSAGAVSAGDPTTSSSSAGVNTTSSSSSYLITCDQVVVHEGVIREKPEDVAEAHRFIHSYARSPAQTVGSVVCTHLGSGARAELVEVCTIHMSDMPDDVIDALIAEGDVMWCAGGLMVEHPLVTPHITSIEGSQESVMGLGREAVMQVLCEAAGVAAEAAAA